MKASGLGLVICLLAAQAHAQNAQNETCTSGYFLESMGYIETYFQNEPARLFQTQLLLRDWLKLPKLKPDGVWGPMTRSTLCKTFATYTAIGGSGPGWGVTSPGSVAEFESWILSATFASLTGGEFPD